MDGIGIAFVSNNDRERVELFNRTLCVPAYAKSGTPFKKNLMRAMNDLGGTLETTVMLRDQLLTDALAGHNLGVKGLIVPPFGIRRTRSSSSSGGRRSLW